MPLGNVCERASKPCYSYEEAKAKAKLARRRTGDRIAEYHCKACGRWHYGHSVGKITQKLNRRPRASPTSPE